MSGQGKAGIDLIARRGNGAEYPENTLPALRSALELGVPSIAVDVQLSSDGVPIVIHDHLLRRTAGRDGSVLDMAATELVRTEAAERDRFGDRHAGTVIPRLSDVVRLLADWPRRTLFVELKRASLARHGRQRMARAVLDALGDAVSRSIVLSQDLPAVEQARHDGATAIGWVLPDFDTHTHLKCEALRPDFLFIDHARLPARGHVWRGPWIWAACEVGTPAAVLALAERGIALFETMQVRGMMRELRLRTA